MTSCSSLTKVAHGKSGGLGERVASLVQGPFRNGRSLRVRAADYHRPQTSLRARANRCSQLRARLRRRRNARRSGSASPKERFKVSSSTNTRTERISKAHADTSLLRHAQTRNGEKQIHVRRIHQLIHSSRSRRPDGVQKVPSKGWF